MTDLRKNIRVKSNNPFTLVRAYRHSPRRLLRPFVIFAVAIVLPLTAVILVIMTTFLPIIIVVFVPSGVTIPWSRDPEVAINVNEQSTP